MGEAFGPSYHWPFLIDVGTLVIGTRRPIDSTEIKGKAESKKEGQAPKAAERAAATKALKVQIEQIGTNRGGIAS